jgi:hypothetical protein
MKNKAWSSYWKISGVSGCTQSVGGVLNQRLSEFWAGNIKECNQESIILDLACGDGFIGKVLQSTQMGIDYLGLDYAKITESNATLGTNTLLGNVDLENPADLKQLSTFPKVSYLVSQFGIEYCDIKTVLNNVRHLLSDKARFQFLMHHSESILAVTSCSENKVLAILLTELFAENKLLNTLIALSQDEQRAQPLKMKELASWFNDLLVNIYTAVDDDVITNDVIAPVLEIFYEVSASKNVMDVNLIEGAVIELESKWRLREEILALQLKSSLSKSSIKTLVDNHMFDLHYKANFEELRIDGHVVGWNVYGTLS